MIIDCISDLHGVTPDLKGGDLLICAGDMTARHTLKEHSDILNWLSKQKYRKKILVPGNHDSFLLENPNFYSETDIDFLVDSQTEFEGLKIWGSPWSLTFQGINPRCTAWTAKESELEKKYGFIPYDIHILITHSPPYGILDMLSETSEHVGSKSLRETVDKLMPEIVLFGHIHEHGGKYVKEEGILYVNGSIVDERYRKINNGRRIVFNEKMPEMQRFKVFE